MKKRFKMLELKKENKQLRRELNTINFVSMARRREQIPTYRIVEVMGYSQRIRHYDDANINLEKHVKKSIKRAIYEDSRLWIENRQEPEKYMLGYPKFEKVYVLFSGEMLSEWEISGESMKQYILKQTMEIVIQARMEILEKTYKIAEVY